MPIHYKTIIAIKSRLNICLRYKKIVKSISSLIKQINAHKILVALLFCLFLKPK